MSVATELLSDPQILIADEPTTGLDAVMAGQMCQSLRNVADAGRSVIVVVIVVVVVVVVVVGSAYHSHDGCDIPPPGL